MYKKDVALIKEIERFVQQWTLLGVL